LLSYREIDKRRKKPRLITRIAEEKSNRAFHLRKNRKSISAVAYKTETRGKARFRSEAKNGKYVSWIVQI